MGRTPACLGPEFPWGVDISNSFAVDPWRGSDGIRGPLAVRKEMTITWRGRHGLVCLRSKHIDLDSADGAAAPDSEE